VAFVRQPEQLRCLLLTHFGQQNCSAQYRGALLRSISFEAIWRTRKGKREETLVSFRFRQASDAQKAEERARD
jgi:hypothetical protein